MIPSALVEVLRPNWNVVVLAPPESSRMSVPSGGSEMKIVSSPVPRIRCERIGNEDRVVARAEDQVRDLGPTQPQLFTGRVDGDAVAGNLDGHVVADAAQVDHRFAVGVAEAVFAEAGGEVVGVQPVHAGQRIGAGSAGDFVDPGSGGDAVVAVVAGDDVGARAAGDAVVAVAPLDPGAARGIGGA